MRALDEYQKSLGFHHHVGFCLYDPVEHKFVVDKNADKYFIPASTLKIQTFYAFKKVLDDKFIGLRYQIKQDTLFIAGSGNPVFLHPRFPQLQRSFEFLQRHDSLKLVIVKEPEPIRPFRPGWAWDDYAYSFQTELSAFPIYGNQFWVYSDGEKTPSFFNPYCDSVFANKVSISRHEDYNIFRWTNSPSITYDFVTVPFKTSPGLLRMLLQDTLQRSVGLIDYRSDLELENFYEKGAHRLLQYLMYASSNFFTEQLIMMLALEQNGYLSPIPPNHIFSNLPDEQKWVDASGLSRYNLTTPRNQVKILEKIYAELDEDEIAQFFPTGGQTGTLKQYYKLIPPFIMAKSGTLSNNYNLCGFLKGDSGKIYLFSFMNNHFLCDIRDLKASMETYLTYLKEKH